MDYTETMFYVYILKSQKDSSRYYVGFTNNLDRRLKEHNDPNAISWTKRFSPWNLHLHIAFQDERKAKEFEVYLKSHSGKAFMHKRLI